MVKLKSSGGLSGDLYVLKLFNCLMWAFYGLPFVHPNDFWVFLTNSIGCVFSCCYIIPYLIYASKLERVCNLFNVMFGRKSMKREKLVDRWCQIAIFAGKMVTMQISTQRRIKTKHRQLTWSLPKYNKLLPRVGLNNQNGRYRKKFPK